MMTGADDGVLRVWDLRSNEIVKSIETGGSTINDLSSFMTTIPLLLLQARKYSF